MVLSGPWMYIVEVAFVIGVLANITALCILHKTAKRRNKKHLFLLRCLATNDLMAQIGMIILTSPIQIGPPWVTCPMFVVIRAFALGSGCVAFIMALERWLALTKPFLYHQLITPQRLKKILICLWLTAVTLTYCPIFGFGVYYDPKEKKCVRFRFAKETKDIVYAYLFSAFGTILCFCITYCNTSVICELYRIRSQQRVLVRRISRSIINKKLHSRYQTPEEVAFAKLMAYVCIIFVMCWIPELMTVPIAQFYDINPSDTKFKKVFLLCDMLLTMYLLLDPFVYVLLGYFEGRINCCCKRSDSNLSIPSMIKTQNSEISLTIHNDTRSNSKPEDGLIALETFNTS
ncbi:unnamed protein product [Phyllotreta striolata]|uniref:Prostaglandin E2 receptor EP4 subtype n=1 Tax=Phyllotreta striolata TaxID=444603 RepID=K9LGM9_PHYSR|nr:prostaglandin E2 receptor EP4 subtype [Phyllotreta striolata]CAG9855094.1 unnamed protein product [Phyllotreta striolata]